MAERDLGEMSTEEDSNDDNLGGVQSVDTALRLLTALAEMGPPAVRLGLATLRHLQGVDVGAQALGELRDALGSTARLAIWGAAGPPLCASRKRTMR